MPILPAAASLLVVFAAGLLGFLGALATLRPAALKTLARALWRQKPGLTVLALLGFVAVAAIHYGGARASVPAAPEDFSTAKEITSARWPVFRGTLARTGHADRRAGPIRGGVQWSGAPGFEFSSSPAIFGRYVLAVGAQGDAARFFCWRAASGELAWSMAPGGYRATFSSPVADFGYLACGEGLHQTPNSRLTCFELGDLQGPGQALQFASTSHIECTPALSQGCVYFGAGDDGIYCLKLPTGSEKSLRVVWHAPGEKYPDAETALAVHDGRVYVGLGYGGEALCVLDAGTGREMARLKVPFPVFSPPAICQGRLYLGMGRANYSVQEPGSPGEVRCLDLDTLATLWTIPTPASVLAAIVADGHDVIYSTVDGQVFAADQQGRVKHRWNARARMLAAPAVTERMIYCVSCDGMLSGLDRSLERLWSVRLGAAGEFISSPVVYGGQVFVGTPQDGFLCVGEPPAETASESWPGRLGGPGRAGAATDSPIPRDVLAAWTIAGPHDGGQADVSAPPAVAGHDLLVPMASTDWAGLICADDARPGEPRQRWTWKCSERIEVSPAISGDIVVCLSGRKGRAGQLAGIERKSGRTLWRRSVERLSDSLSVDADAAYLAEDGLGLSRFSLSGKRLWKAEIGPLAAPIHVAGEIIAAVVAEPSRLVALDRISGQVLWQVSLRRPAADSPVVIQDEVCTPTAQAIEVRSLLDGRLLDVLDAWRPSAPAFIDRERIVTTSSKGEIAFGSLHRRRVQRRWPGARPELSPLVGADAVVFAEGEGRLMRAALDGAQSPELWYQTDGARRIAASPLLVDGRVYLAVAGAGLICLEARQDN